MLLLLSSLTLLLRNCFKLSLSLDLHYTNSQIEGEIIYGERNVKQNFSNSKQNGERNVIRTWTGRDNYFPSLVRAFNVRVPFGEAGKALETLRCSCLSFQE